MTVKPSIELFLSQRKIAVVGVSRSGKRFGTAVYNDLLQKGYKVYGVNRYVERGETSNLYRSLTELPEPVGGILPVA